jgi:hypothetical protein|tara:strand:- start:418 stop:861 length:444 start_codon:yes stop_codon:yes gene_type:complete
MLLEMAAANLAFKTVTTFLNNGKTLYECGSSLTDYFSASSEINKKAGSSTSSGSALESYQAQQELKKQREQLKWHMNKSALMGWSDYLAFEAEWHRERKAEEQAVRVKAAKRQQELEANMSIGIKVLGVIFLAMAMLFGVAVYIKGY